jgi:hypothetical protein
MIKARLLVLPPGVRALGETTLLPFLDSGPRDTEPTGDFGPRSPSTELLVRQPSAFLSSGHRLAGATRPVLRLPVGQTRGNARPEIALLLKEQ